MITVYPNNVSKKPVELHVSISYKTLIKALKHVAKEKNMPIEIVESKYDIDNSWKSFPCVAVYHTKHKKDYHCAVIELKEAYGENYAYVHLGGRSKNQMGINMGKTYTYINSNGELAQNKPGFLGRLFSSEGEAGLKDEELYYDALYKTIRSALDLAEIWTIDPPKREPAPRPAAAQQAAQTVQQQSAPREAAPQSVSTQPAPQKTVTSTEPRQKLEKSIGIETMGGVFYKLISAGTDIPVEKTMTFSTAADKQTSVEINVLQGENEKACDNVSLGKYKLDGITPAPRGVPQIEVTFSVNKYGELDLFAVDQSSDKELVIFVDNILGVRNEPEQKKQPEPQQTKEAPPLAEFQCEVSQSDDELFKWMDADICLLTPDGVTIDIFKKHTYVSTGKAITLTVAVDEGSSFDIQVLECNKTSAEEQRTLGTISLSKLPYSCDRNLQVELYIYVKSKGQAEVTAKLLPSGKYLPIAFVPNQLAEPKATAPKQPAQAEKSKVEQLKDLVDLLDRGALTQEEFEILKKKILYN